MKKYRWLTALLILALALTACSGNAEPAQEGHTQSVQMETQAPEEEYMPLHPVMTEEAQMSLDALRQDLRADGCLAAIIYLGYHESNAMDMDMYRLQEPYLEEHLYLAEIPYEYYLTNDGYDLYALIPADPDSAVAVEAWDDNTGTAEAVLYDGLGDPLLLQGNISDIMPNLAVTIEDPQGNLLSMYHPFLSLENGCVAMPDAPRGLITDLTHYEFLDAPSREHVQEVDMTYFNLFRPNEAYTALEPVWTGMEYVDENAVFQFLLDNHVIPDPVVLNSFYMDGKELYLDLSEYFGPYIESCDPDLTYMIIGSIVDSYLNAYEADWITITVDGGFLPLYNGDLDGSFAFLPMDPVPIP